MIFAWLLGVALADDLDNWQRLHRIQLAESANGDLRGAIAAYKQLSSTLDSQDPLLPETLYWLGRANFAARDLASANAALTECARRVSPWRQRCLDALAEIALFRSAIRDVPTRWDFSGDHGVLHPSPYEDKARSLRVEPVDGDARLAWTTTVDPSRDDQVVIGFDQPSPTPKGFRVTLRSTTFDARVRVDLFDAYGRRFQLAQVALPAGRDVPVDVRFGGMRTDGEVALDPALVDRVVIQDVTAYYSRARGANTLLLDDVEVF
jgi:hypothetical protein